MESNSFSSQSQKQKAEILQALVSGPLASSASKLSGYSRGIPSDKDFHFYNNFDEFRVPARAIADTSESSLRSIGSSSLLWGNKKLPAFPDDLDEAYDWLVNLNDEFLERFGVCMDEFKSSRLKEENGGRIGSMEESGFQLVYGKKKKGAARYSERDESLLASSSSTTALGVKVASKDKKTTSARSRVPFHIPTIPRPQDEFNILVNNANEPFTHVWLERSDDGSRFVHPLEKFSVLDFVETNVVEGEPEKPLPIESTPFKLVESVKDLKELAAKLQNVNEFAVDLEHNQYRSFQGLTCLMQISTRTEDFVIDTLKLRVHVGPHLREVFKDPSKRKVMHGADRDIFWLQRDFGIYVCNLFDTGQASRVMLLERNSLEYLLHHFCQVTANKEYQNADWRLRPLPDEMLKYGREDTHYLLHIYDLMRSRLLSTSSDENGDTLLIEVYKRSYEICMQLYEKELLTDTSYLYIYGLHEADFNSQQLAIVAGLCEWRDNIARTEDESTGYILPNKTLLDIARQMPLSSGKLLRLVKSKHPFVERQLNSVIGIIRSSIQNAFAFESVCEQLKKGRPEAAPRQNLEAVRCNSESLPPVEDPMDSTIAKGDIFISASTMHGAEQVKDDHLIPANTELCSGQIPSVNKCSHGEKLQPMSLSEIGCSSMPSDRAGTTDKENTENGSAKFLKPAKAANLASVQMLKKPTGAFGALLGNTSSKRKFSNERDKTEIKIEMIKSSVTLPFHSFTGGEKPFEPSPVEDTKHPHRENMQECADQPAEATRMEEEPAEVTKLEEVILLENETENSRSSTESPVADDGLKHREWFPRLPENGNNEGIQSESNMEEGSMSLLNLSSSFQKCFQSINERRNSKQNQRPSQEVDSYFQLKPFDYAAARKQMKLGKAREQEGELEGADGLKTFGSKKTRKGSGSGRARAEERDREFQQPRRRQAFPQSGNRSATFRQ